MPDLLVVEFALDIQRNNIAGLGKNNDNLILSMSMGEMGSPGSLKSLYPIFIRGYHSFGKVIRCTNPKVSWNLNYNEPSYKPRHPLRGSKRRQRSVAICQSFLAK